MRFGDEESVVATFFDMAKKYCQWAEAPAEPGDALRALRLVASLYDVALVLPETSPGDVSQSEERTKIETGAIYERFQQLPFRYYHDTFDPLADPPEEPITGDIADDLRDIYLDLWRGVRSYQAGRRDDAVFEWQFGFGVHWGRHATGAMRALHQ